MVLSTATSKTNVYANRLSLYSNDQNKQDCNKMNNMLPRLLQLTSWSYRYTVPETYLAPVD